MVLSSQARNSFSCWITTPVLSQHIQVSPGGENCSNLQQFKGTWSLGEANLPSNILELRAVRLTLWCRVSVNAMVAAYSNHHVGTGNLAALNKISWMENKLSSDLWSTSQERTIRELSQLLLLGYSMCTLYTLLTQRFSQKQLSM